jgi:TetR/AcrR family transcriptional regulator, transcriptional repressor for nem operon
LIRAIVKDHAPRRETELMPKASVRDRLIESALEVFHTHGFNGSGVQDIVEAAGVPKGSFYNHFASKEALGVEVVRAYSALVGTYVVEAGAADIFTGDGTPLQRIRAYFEAVIEQNVSCGVRKGCLLGNFATELAPHSVEIAKAVTAALDNWSAAVAKALAQAQEAGELPKDAEVDALARYMVDGYEGAATRAKLIGDRAPMDDFIRTTFDVLLPAGGGVPSSRPHHSRSRTSKTPRAMQR